MKRATLWIVGAGVVSVALMLALRAQEQQAQAPAPEGVSVTPAEERAAFTFTDEAQMQQFAQLWQQRQGMITRMAVLQAYFSQEQASLAQVNQLLLSQYNLDVTKNYTLDPQRKVLIEREAAPEQPLQVGQAQPPTEQPAAP